VPVLNGSNLDEWRYGVAFLERLTKRPITPETYPATIAEFFSVRARSAQLTNVYLSVGPEKVLAEYPLDRYPSASEAVAAAETDAFMACPALKMNEWLSELTPTYGYEFSYRNAWMYWSPPSFPYGAAHTAELQFLFPAFHWGPDTVSRTLNEQEQILFDRMVAYWTNFAKSGAPTPSEPNEWPKFAKGSPRLMKLDLGAPALDDTFAQRHRCEFWDSVSIR
jgi:para-nitrobenzyl esterase